MEPASAIRLGTRASALARWQADWVAARLEELGVTVELVPITTTGDREQRGPIGSLGSQGVFTKEIQRALIEDRIDLAVHSLKDLPTEPVEGLGLAVVPERETVRDALISRENTFLAELPDGARVGSGSMRRQSQLLHHRPGLALIDIRGNVDTRLAKLDENQYDAIILAEAGLKRLGLADRITELVNSEIMLPAVGQGALGLETRSDDEATRSALAPLDHPATHAAVVAERSMLAALRGGCLAPIAAWGRFEENNLVLTGRVLSVEGAERIEATETTSGQDAATLGQAVAQRLMDQGATELIATARS
jgi:hydroxymethylbilane synthase